MIGVSCSNKQQLLENLNKKSKIVDRCTYMCIVEF